MNLNLAAQSALCYDGLLNDYHLCIICPDEESVRDLESVNRGDVISSLTLVTADGGLVPYNYKGVTALRVLKTARVPGPLLVWALHLENTK